jgi:MFS family permease
MSPKARQETFIRRNLIIVAVAEILMTIPQSGIPLLFSTRIQRIMCIERQLPCAQLSIAPPDTVIGDTNVLTSSLASALGASNFLGTLLIGSVSDAVGRRSCILVVALGLVADSLVCLLCNDIQVCARAALCESFR